LLLLAVACCCLLLPAVACCCLLLPAAACCHHSYVFGSEEYPQYAPFMGVKVLFVEALRCECLLTQWRLAIFQQTILLSTPQQ
jgi:hypothetical protein